MSDLWNRGEVGMTSKEAIDKLERMINSPVGRKEIDETCFEVMKYLAAQEPRVMTLEEVQVSSNPVWLEGGMAGGTWAMMPFMREYSIEFVANGVCTIYPAFAINEYGKTWRCWTSRPDQVTREATPW